MMKFLFGCARRKQCLRANLSYRYDVLIQQDTRRVNLLSSRFCDAISDSVRRKKVLETRSVLF